VTNSGSDDVSAYSIDATTGELTEVAGSPFASGTAPHSIRVEPSGKYAYVANTGSNNISGYVIDPATGALRSIGTVATGSVPVCITIDPTGKFAYVANRTAGTFRSPSGGDISVYTINSSTGALSEIAGSRFESAFLPSYIAVVPSGKFAYVTDAAFGWIYIHGIDAASGALSRPITFTSIGSRADFLTIDPSGRFLYVTDDTDSVRTLAIDPSTGMFSEVTGSPFGQTGAAPGTMQLDPLGKFGYVANFASRNVSAYMMDTSTGALSEVPGSPFAAELNPRGVSVDPSGKFVYVANENSNNVWAYTINATTGALRRIGAAVATRSTPNSITTTRRIQ
jgi:6-phosphogluconolactonase